MTMTQHIPRGAYFEAHEQVAEATRTYTVQARKVSRLRRRLAQEQALLAVLDLQVTNLTLLEDAELGRLG